MKYYFNLIKAKSVIFMLFLMSILGMAQHSLIQGIKEETPNHEAIEAIKKNSKELYEALMGLKEDLVKEAKKNIDDALSAAKLDNLNRQIEAVTNQLKENTKKVDEFENLKITMENEINQKIASLQLHNVTDEKEELRAVERIFNCFLRTGALEGVKEDIERFKGEKAATPFQLSGNEFIIPSQIDQDIQRKLSSSSLLLGLVNSVTATKDYRKLINVRGVGTGKAGDADDRSEKDAPSLKEITLYDGDLYTKYYVTQHSIDDSGVNLAEELLDSVDMDFSEQIDIDIISGTGSDEPKGITQYDLAASPTWGKFTRKLAANASKLTYLDILGLIHTIKPRYRRNANFVGSPSFIQNAITIEDANGNLVFRPSFNEGRYAETILGYPLVEHDELGDVEAAAVPAYFGNFYRGYLLRFILGKRVIRDPYTKKGFVEFYTSQRYGGGAADFFAIGALKMPAGS